MDKTLINGDVQDFHNGWRWKDEYGLIWGDVYYTRNDAIQNYVFTMMYWEVADLMGRKEIESVYDIPKELIQKLWRRERRSGRIKLVKSTQVNYAVWSVEASI